MARQPKNKGYRLAPEITDQKVSFKFTITELNNYIGYLMKEKSAQITNKSLSFMQELFDKLDDTPFESDKKLYERVYFIRRALKARLERGMENESIIIDYCRSDNPGNKESQDIVRNIPIYKKLNYNEINYINRQVSDYLRNGYVKQYQEPLYELMERIDSGDYDSLQEINDEVKALMKAFLNETRKLNIVDEVPTFSFQEQELEMAVEDIANRLSDPSRILYTGIEGLNQILAPGYRGKRLYIFMGLPAGFKSGIMLKSALDMKKYNNDTPAKNPKARRTILLVTMENDVDETVERLFNMSVTTQDIREFTPKQIIKKMRENNLVLTTTEGIDILIKYYPNRSISTDDLYTIIDDLEDDNREIISLVLDYIKRIRPAERAKDEKEELKNVTNELKTLATEKNIPVITAHQLNRQAAAMVDAASGSDDPDAGLNLGRSHVGSAWEVMENADWACIINTVIDQETGQWYLMFKRIKLRYRDTAEDPITRFFQPFVMGNRIQLMDDVHLEEPLLVKSLKTDFLDIDVEKKGKRNARKREVIGDLNGATQSMFDFSNTANSRK